MDGKGVLALIHVLICLLWACYLCKNITGKAVAKLDGVVLQGPHLQVQRSAT